MHEVNSYWRRSYYYHLDLNCISSRLFALLNNKFGDIPRTLIYFRSNSFRSGFVWIFFSSKIHILICYVCFYVCVWLFFGFLYTIEGRSEMPVRDSTIIFLIYGSTPTIYLCTYLSLECTAAYAKSRFKTLRWTTPISAIFLFKFLFYGNNNKNMSVHAYIHAAMHLNARVACSWKLRFRVSEQSSKILDGLITVDGFSGMFRIVSGIKFSINHIII